MKISEVKKKYKNKWVLAKVLKQDKLNQAVEVTPIMASKDRNDLYKRMTTLPRGTHVATLYTGEIKGAFLFYVSSVETTPKIIIPEIKVLGKKVKNVEAIVKDLPPEAPADGLLGLSFLKHFELTIDFKKGILGLE